MIKNEINQKEKNMNEITTTDFAKFGHREKAMAAKLLNTMVEHGLPEDFYDDEVTIMMNMNSGNVFFTNSQFQVSMMNGEKLESFYSCPNCGNEGFKEEIDDSEKECCLEYLKDWLN